MYRKSCMIKKDHPEGALMMLWQGCVGEVKQMTQEHQREKPHRSVVQSSLLVLLGAFHMPLIRGTTPHIQHLTFQAFSLNE
jgi:hypothetical protein